MPDLREEELRFKVSVDLMAKLDAVRQAKGFESRGDLLIPILEEMVRKEIHAAKVLLRIARINPLLADESGSGDVLGGSEGNAR